MRNAQRLILVGVALLTLFGCAHWKDSPDAEFQALSAEYLAGHLAWRPTVGMALGLHEYDGRITDFSRASLDAERKRIQSFEARLAHLHTNRLSREASFDYRLLQSTL